MQDGMPQKIDGESGHIVAVVLESDDEKAKRDSDGLVTSPVQSQAGVTNFRYCAARSSSGKGISLPAARFGSTAKKWCAIEDSNL